MPTATQDMQTTSLQGIVVPTTAINPQEFFARTRRLRFKQYSTGTFAGLGGTEEIVIKQAGIVSALVVRLYGTIVTAKGTGTVATTARWPYDIVKSARFSANGQSNLINVSGGKLAARRMLAPSNGLVNDRGVTRGVGGASPGTQVNQGTLSTASESWGLGQNVSAIPDGTYDVDLQFLLPVAMDEKTLIGAIFAQTASTSLDVNLDYASESDLFTLTADAAVTMNLGVKVDGRVYSIPVGSSGDIVVPNLSTFHSFIQSNDYSIGQGENESALTGTGVGRQLMRVLWQLWEGSPRAYLPINDTNFGQLGWRYGGNNTPEIFGDGSMLRHQNEDDYSVDVGAAGFAVHDFSNVFAFRDSVDEGSASNLRLVINRSGAPTSPKLEVVQETLFAGAAGA